MLFSAIGISITMLTLLVANSQNTISQIISFSVGSMSLFSIYVGGILICFYNGSSICIILCIICRLLSFVVTACENLSVFIHIMMTKRKWNINYSIKSEYPFIKSVNENVECMLCNAKFCIAHGGQSNSIYHVKTKRHKLAVQNKA
jgi:hypothetical protein